MVFFGSADYIVDCFPLKVGHVILVFIIMVLTTEEKVFIVECYFHSYGIEHSSSPNLINIANDFQKQGFKSHPLVIQ